MLTIVRPTFIYDVRKSVPPEDVANAIIATSFLIRQSIELISHTDPGLDLKIQDFRLERISQQSPLQEWFFVALFTAFQDGLRDEAPAIIEELIGRDIPAEYDTIVTVMVLLLVYMGVVLSLRYARRRIDDAPYRKKYNAMLSEIANQCGQTPERVQDAIERRLSAKKQPGLIRQALRFIRPAKHESGTEVRTPGGIIITNQEIRRVPMNEEVEGQKIEEKSEMIRGAKIILRAQDRDRAKSGWAGIVPEVSSRRLKMQVYPPAKAEDLYLLEEFTADIIVIKRPSLGGNYEPYLFHVVSVQDPIPARAA
jgi:hypothetical protein